MLRECLGGQVDAKRGQGGAKGSKVCKKVLRGQGVQEGAKGGKGCQKHGQGWQGGKFEANGVK